MASVEHEEHQEVEQILQAEGGKDGEAAQTEAVGPVTWDQAPRRGGNIEAQHKGHGILGINAQHSPTSRVWGSRDQCPTSTKMKGMGFSESIPYIQQHKVHGILGTNTLHPPT